MTNYACLDICPRILAYDMYNVNLNENICLNGLDLGQIKSKHLYRPGVKPSGCCSPPGSNEVPCYKPPFSSWEFPSSHG